MSLDESSVETLPAKTNFFQLPNLDDTYELKAKKRSIDDGNSRMALTPLPINVEKNKSCLIKQVK